MQRSNNRELNQLREVSIETDVNIHAEGSALVKFGNTHVLCTATIEDSVPRWMRGSNEGWITAEYGMLPRSTNDRMNREAARGKQSGRTQEIQRLIGRSYWELSTLGHPIADFSYHCLSWRTQEAFWDQSKLKELGIPNEREYMDMYCENTGKDLSKNWEFYMAFNMFKIAGILQGILGRVRDGTAASKHAEDRGDQVIPLAAAAWDLVEKNYR